MGYVNERLGGLVPRDPEPEETVLVPGRERDRFAELAELYDRHFRFIYMYPDISMEEVKDTPAIVERFRPSTVVMSQNEVHPRAKIKTVGQI